MKANYSDSTIVMITPFFFGKAAPLIR